MPPDFRKNEFKGVSTITTNKIPKKFLFGSEVSPTLQQTSGMGKHGGSSKTMKHLGMCDNLNAQNSRDSLLLKDNEEQNEANYPVTVKLFDRFEDVEDVKLKVKSKQMNNIQSDINQWNGKDENVIFSPNVGEINSNGGHNLSNTGCECSGGNVTNSNMVNGSCLSSELDKLHVSDTSNLGRHRSVSDTKLIRLDSPALPTYTEKSHTKVKAGLLMSPIALTQDIPIDIGKDQNRFSYVMENIPSLLYLPNTKQLVRSQPVSRQNSIGSHGAHSNGVEDLHKEICIDANTSFNGNDQSLELVSPESNSSFSETCPFPVGANDNSNIDADQMTLNSVECLIPGELNDRGCNDTSSLSSVSTDFSTTVGEDNSEFKNVSLEGDETGFMEVNLHSRNSYQRSQSSASDETKSKKKGFGNFLSRSIFSKRSKDTTESSAPGWKLFGHVPPKSSGEKEAAQISQEYQAKLRASQLAPSHPKKQDVEVSSTTALILENRPMNLPSKDPEEAEKHRLQYEQMIECAKKKEQREFKLRKKQLQNQLRQEDQLAKSSRIWNNEILPNWETMRSSKKARDLWWYGLPPSVRGKVWRLALGNELNVTAELYKICIGRADEKIKLMQDSESVSSYDPSCDTPSNKEDSVSVIRLDVSRTFPHLCIFQKGGPYHDLLHSLLGAYATYRPDVGYVQGMSFIAGILLLNMEAADAFICFANLLNRPCQVTFFRMDEAMMTAYYKTFEEYFKENLPVLYDHFDKQNLTPDLYLIDWIFLLYSKSLPLDVVCRVWDVFWRDGEEFIFRTALGILRAYEKTLLSLDFIHIAQFLTKLPEDVTADFLFHNIEPIKMTIDKKKFSNILSTYKDNGES